MSRKDFNLMKLVFWPYYISHALVTLVIAGVLWPVLSLPVGLVAGVAFYVGREFTQWEQGGGTGLPFDWPGIIAPLITCAFVFVVYFTWPW